MARARRLWEHKKAIPRLDQLGRGWLLGGFELAFETCRRRPCQCDLLSVVDERVDQARHERARRRAPRPVSGCVPGVLTGAFAYALERFL